MILYSKFVFITTIVNEVFAFIAALSLVVVVGAASVFFLHLMNESKQNQLVFRFIVGIEIYAFP